MIEPKIKIVPSLICADYGRLYKEVKRLEASGADMFHFDIMDGHFVENFGMTQVEMLALRPVTKIPFDVHLAIENPGRYIKLFSEAGANSISIHVETCYHLLYEIQKIKAEGIKAAVAINPATSLSAIQHILTEVDMVLVMMVNPGYRKQSYFPECLGKIKELRKTISQKGLNIDIQVDGGVYENTIALMAKAGANAFVAGGAIFDSGRPIEEAIAHLRSLAQGAYMKGEARKMRE